jgi:hypothetical protein
MTAVWSKFVGNETDLADGFKRACSKVADKPLENRLM